MLLYEMLAGRSPFDIVGATDNPDQNTEDYLFQVRDDMTLWTSVKTNISPHLRSSWRKLSGFPGHCLSRQLPF